MARTNIKCSGKHLSKSPATVKGNLNQQRMNARSHKIKEETRKVTTEGDLDYRKKPIAYMPQRSTLEKSTLTKVVAFL
jgi:hypothetical protein